MRNLTVVPKVTECNLTADQWELYTAIFNCNKAARALNSAFKRLVNSGMDRVKVYHEMAKVMDKYSAYGAADSEPYYVLEDLLKAVYGGSNNDYYSV